MPAVRTSASVRAHIAVDDATLAAFRLLRRPPSESAWQEMLAEARAAQALFLDAGWVADPRSFHASSPTADGFELRRGRIGGREVERLTFASGWAPPVGAPARDRWLGWRANRTAHATVLRHRDGPRPWVVCLHGAGMGRDGDLRMLRAPHLFEDLGCNVVLPILPLHGRRRHRPYAEAPFPSAHPVENVYGIAQAAHELRQILTWIRAQSPTALALQGVSLGGYVTALVAGLESALDCVIAIIPVTDFPTLFRSQTPPGLQARLAPMMEPATTLHAVVSPLRFVPATPVGRRHLVGGLVDRFVDPVEQVAPLWRHWEQPSIRWYPGGHIGYVVRRDVRWFVDIALIRNGVSRVD